MILISNSSNKIEFNDWIFPGDEIERLRQIIESMDSELDYVYHQLNYNE